MEGALRVIAIVAVVAMAGSVGAQTKTQAAREAAENGRRAYNLSHWDEAVTDFEKAYQLSGDPALLFNLAQAHRQAGHGSEALRFYKAYLREQPSGPNREIAEKQLNELQAQSLHDSSDVPKATASLPAPPAPAAPAAAPPPPPVQVAPAPSPAPTSPSAVPAASDAPVVVAPPPPARGTPLPRWLPLAGAVTTVALAGAAAGFGISASHRYDELAMSCGRTTAGCAASDVDAVRSRDKIATALWIAAGVVGVGTGVAIVVNTHEAGVSALWRF